MDTRKGSRILRSLSYISHTRPGPWDMTGTQVDPQGPIYSSSNSIDGYRGPRQPSSVHACTHIRYTVMPILAAWVKKTTSEGNPSAVSRGNVFTCPSTLSVNSPSIDLRQLDSAMADLRGEIPTDVLLPNFVAELPEALTMHKQLMKNVFSHSPSSWSSAGVLYAKSQGKRVANTHLLYQFGIAPLAKDIVSLAKLSSRVKSRIKHLSSLSSENFTSWRRSVSVSPSAFAPSWSGFWAVQPSQTIAEPSADLQLFARIKRTRKINPTTSQALGMLDAAGITQVGSVIWEAIPFSFVADWFYPCGRALDALNVQAFEGCLANQMVGNQAHFKSVFRFLGRVPGSGTAWYNSDLIEFARATAQFYHRAGGFPSTSTAVNYGLRQTLLSGSLVLQKI